MKKVWTVILVFMMIIGNISFGEVEETEYVNVTIPKFDVRINGKLIDSKSEKYPLIVYKGITYIPMTWSVSSALGLKYTWSNETGISIYQNSKAEYLEMKGGFDNSIYKSYQAKIVSYGVKINDRVINNSEEKYPLLNFRNITYFPMTYRFMVNDFNTEYQYSEEKGLSVKANPKLPMEYPEPVIIREDVIVEDLIEFDGYASSNFKVYKAAESAYFFNIKYDNEEHAGDLYNVTFNYYDTYDHYLYSSPYYVGALYEKPSGRDQSFGWQFLLNQNAKFLGRIEVEIEFIEQEVAQFMVEKEARDQQVSFEYLTTSEVTHEKIIADGAAYIYPVKGKCADFSVKPSHDLLQYAAYYTVEKFILDDQHDGEYYTLAISNKIGFNNIKDYLWNLGFYTDFKYTADEYRSLNFEGYVNDDLFNTGTGDFIRLYDENKNLIKIYIVTDALEYFFTHQ